MPGSEAADAVRRRFGVDPRLLIGLGLVVASVSGVVGIVAAADASTPVYAAASPLAPGDRIDVDDLVTRSVVLDGAGSLYVGIGEVPAEGLVVTRPVADGELLPASSVGSSAAADLTSLVVELPGRVSAAIRPGASVDIWGAVATDDAAAEGDGNPPPTVLVPDAVVVRVLDDDGLVAATETVAVEVLVGRSTVARLLQATADGQTMSLVPAGRPLGSTP